MSGILPVSKTFNCSGMYFHSTVLIEPSVDNPAINYHKCEHCGSSKEYNIPCKSCGSNIYERNR